MVGGTALATGTIILSSFVERGSVGTALGDVLQLEATQDLASCFPLILGQAIRKS